MKLDTQRKGYIRNRRVGFKLREGSFEALVHTVTVAAIVSKTMTPPRIWGRNVRLYLSILAAG